jgi:tetratricopeptide (TPR) repeat protein
VAPVLEIFARQAEESLRAYLRMQEQLHTALLAIQQSRVEASAEAQTNMGTMLGRLEMLERELAGQRAQEAKASRDSNRLMMLAAAGIFLVGVLAMVATVIIQARGMNRLAEIAVGLAPAARGLSAGPGHDAMGLPLSLPGAADRMLLGNGGGHGAESERLHSTIRQLEERIRDMELAHQGGIERPPSRAGDRDNLGAGAAMGAGPGMTVAPRAILLAKVQTLMNLGEPQAALGAIEEALGTEPNDAELQLRRGMALERLQRLDPAIEAYNRAIAIDARCTQAYLSKGGVLNRQARYQEALACYEQALKN